LAEVKTNYNPDTAIAEFSILGLKPGADILKISTNRPIQPATVNLRILHQNVVPTDLSTEKPTSDDYKYPNPDVDEDNTSPVVLVWSVDSGTKENVIEIFDSSNKRVDTSLISNGFGRYVAWLNKGERYRWRVSSSSEVCNGSLQMGKYSEFSTFLH
jgi:hypothetical protein